MNAHDDGRPKFVLRSLPGVAELEAILDRCELHPNPKWAPARDEADALAAKLSRQHFGMTEAETRYQKNHLLRAHENEHNESVWEFDFDFLRRPFGRQLGDWEGLGWDVRRSDGGPMRALEFLGRQIIAATLEIAGHLPDEAGELSDEAKQGIETQLRADAERFRRGR